MFSKNRKFKRLRGFSLIEVAVVILIIGIFVSGILAANKMINKFRLAAAESLTVASPINSIPEVAMWLETSLESSFNQSEATNGAEITTWSDQKKSSPNKVVISCNSVAGCPTYSNTINRIHAVEFNNGGFLEFDGSFLNKTDYTIIVLEKRKSSGSNNYFLGSASAGANDSILLGYGSDSVVVHKQGSNSYAADSAVEGYSDSKEKARLFVFTHSATEGKKTYINGTLASEDSSNTAPLSGVATLAIGKGYVGEIGEIAIFTKALRVSERKAVEDYLGKKWSRKVNREAAPRCLVGAVTDSGCDAALASCTVSATGVSATVGPASSPAPLNCNAANYDPSSSVNYTCINGTGTITGGSCTCIAGYDISTGCTSCLSGYLPSGSGSSLVCTPAASCSVSVTGVATPTTVNHGDSNTLTCNAAGYSGLAGPTYNCVNGNLNLGGTPCQCAAGRDIANNCACLSGYTEVAGVCEQDCAVPNSTLGITDGTKVVKGTTSKNCNVTNYTGEITYTCGSGGAINITANTCAAPCTASVSSTTYNGKTVFTFLASGGTFSCPSPRNIEVLVVGGGGAGNSSTDGPSAGGGGGGGVVYAAAYPIVVNFSYSPVIGAGGAAPGSGCMGNDGGSSNFGTLTALGGGGGGGGYTFVYPCTGTKSTRSGRNGGSGGGASNNSTTLAPPGNSIQTAQTNQTAHYGNASGSVTAPCTGLSLFNRCGGSGGGGAGSVGGNPTSNGAGGAGGSGIQIPSISASYYAGGGGGARSQYAAVGVLAGVGGSGGGGNSGVAGTANTGGGGGDTKAGGSGIVIIAY